MNRLDLSELTKMSDSHSHFLPGSLISSQLKNKVAVWFGEGDIPKGWKRISEKEAIELLNKEVKNAKQKTSENT